MAKKPTLGLCMIVKNEEEVIGRCLDSCCDLFDEMIIVDTGSVDKTKEILEKYPVKVYDFEWIYDFSAARNFSFSKSTCDFIMWLDADDVIYKEELEKLKELKNKLDDKVDIYQMHYSYLQDENDNTTYLQDRARIVKNNHKDRWQGMIHEYMEFEGNIEKTDITIHHKKIEVAEPTRNLDIYWRMKKQGIEFSLRDLYLFSQELKGNNYNTEALETVDKFFSHKDEYKYNKFYFDDAIMIKHELYERINMGVEDIKKILLEYLEFAKPTPFVCCKLGEIFNSLECYDTAKYWFLLAIRLGEDDPQAEVDYNAFLPFFGIAYSFYYLGDKENAVKYSKKALKLKPGNKACEDNLKLYENM